MLPVLFSAGDITVSSFGVFLAFGFLAGIFLIWRLCRAWDLDEEKILDLILLTFIGALIGARIFFAAEHFSSFASLPLNIILINKMPGFSFWGGFLGGWLTLFYFTGRFRADFRQLADIALVGFLAGLILTDLGCFFGACGIGTVTKSFLGVSMVGFIGKRWPVQIIESVLLFLIFLRIWSRATHFHQRGRIVSIGFIWIGLIKLLLLPFKQDRSEFIFALILTLLGLTLYYLLKRQNPVTQLRKLGNSLLGLIQSSGARKLMVQKIGKYWYNQKSAFLWQTQNFKKFLRRKNVKIS